MTAVRPHSLADYGCQPPGDRTILDLLLVRARDLPPSRCLYDGDDDSWCEGFKDGVDFALCEMRDHPGGTGRIMDAMDAHHADTDTDCYRCTCGRGYATRRDLNLHVAEEALAAALAWENAETD